jgi:hypothetical protein
MSVAGIATGAPQTNDKRHAARVKVAWKVKAITSLDGDQHTCIVQDVSEGGARLRVPKGVQLPDQFALYLPLRNETQEVHVRWRDSNSTTIGVAFVEPVETLTARHEVQMMDEIASIQKQIEKLEDHLQMIGSQLFKLKLTVAQAGRSFARAKAKAVEVG